MNKIILSILALAFVSLSAEPCCTRNGQLGIEFLLLKPSIDQQAFVISSSENVVGGEFFPSGTRHNNNFCYEPGFRITGAAPICGVCSPEVEARFTYLTASHTSAVTGPFLFDTVGWPGSGAIGPEDTSYNGTARVHNAFVYYGLDTTYGRFAPVYNLELFAGLHGAYIKHKTDFTSVGNFIEVVGGVPTTMPVSNLLQEYSSFWGVGPQIGFDYGYLLPYKLNLVTSVRVSLLCSDTQSNTHYSSLRTAGTDGVNVKNQTIWRVTPAIDARIGAVYKTCCYSYDTSFEAGYEWIWYHNAVDQVRGSDVAFAGLSHDHYSDLSLQGPYVRMAVSF